MDDSRPLDDVTPGGLGPDLSALIPSPPRGTEPPAFRIADDTLREKYRVD